MQADMFRLHPNLLAEFEARLDEFTRNASTGNFCGNELVFSLVANYIRTGGL
jgi:hypothetical protein